MNFKKAIVLASILGSLALPLAAAAQSTGSVLEMSARSVPVNGNTYVLVTIANNGVQILDHLNFKCVFTFQGEPVSVVTGSIQRLAPGKSDTVQVYANNQIHNDDYTCKPTQAMVYF